MLRKILLVIILVFLISGVGFAFQNEPEGFRELKWGDPPGEDMVWAWTTEYGKSLYKLPEEMENLNLGDTKLWAISYLFYGEPKRFMEVLLRFWDELDYLNLKILCRARFGNETTERSYPPYCLWVGSTTTVVLQYTKYLSYLSLQSTLISAECAEAKRKKETEKAESDW